MRTLLKLNEEKLVFYDIETAPAVKELQLDTPLFDSWAYKVNKTGDKTNDEIIASYSSEAGLYPEFAKIVSIVVGKIISNKIHLITLDDVNEVDILNSFNKLLERNIDNTLVGFVNIGFDTPFVFKRMVINGIAPHDKVDSSGLKPWEVSEVDLAMEWKGTSFNRASLINVATAFGLPSPKDDISGADVGKVYWEEGVRRISKYCRKDVATTINIFRKMRLEEALEVATDEPIVIEEIPLIKHLFAGGKFGKDEKFELEGLLKMLDDSERVEAFTILDAMCSAAKGKKTKILKKDVKELRKQFA